MRGWVWWGNVCDGGWVWRMGVVGMGGEGPRRGRVRAT